MKKHKKIKPIPALLFKYDFNRLEGFAIFPYQLWPKQIKISNLKNQILYYSFIDNLRQQFCKSNLKKSCFL